jgi:tetratricopeptide (TPR) repeat protein
LWLEQHPDDAHALVLRGGVVDRFSPREAIHDFQRAIELVPGHVVAHLWLGSALLEQNQPKNAKSHFVLLQKAIPKDPTVLVGLAECEYGLGKMDEAGALLDEALKIDGKNAAALRERGRLAMAVGEPAKAEEWLQKAVANDPWDSIGLYSLALCAQQLGKETEAKRWIEKHRAAAEDAKQLDQLLRDLDRNPDDASILTKAGAIFLKTGRADESLRCCKIALKLDAKHRPAHALLADYYERVGRKELAEEHRKLAKAPEK